MASNPILNGPPNTLNSGKPALHSQPSTGCSQVVTLSQNPALAKCEMSLREPTIQEIQAALAPLLALCAPLGMTANDRVEWITAAADTLRDVPPDLLASACRKARAACDHPAKIIPFVMNEVKDAKAERHAHYRELRRQLEPMPQTQNRVDPAERKKVAAMMTEWKAHNYSAEYARHRGWA